MDDDTTRAAHLFGAYFPLDDPDSRGESSTPR
jgi:hypothetical protein